MWRLVCALSFHARDRAPSPRRGPGPSSAVLGPLQRRINPTSLPIHGAPLQRNMRHIPQSPMIEESNVPVFQHLFTFDLQSDHRFEASCFTRALRLAAPAAPAGWRIRPRSAASARGPAPPDAPDDARSPVVDRFSTTGVLTYFKTGDPNGMLFFFLGWCQNRTGLLTNWIDCGCFERISSASAIGKEPPGGVAHVQDTCCGSNS